MRSAVRPSQRSGRVVCFQSPCSSLSRAAERAMEFSPDELIGSETPRFRVFGVGVERDAGHIEESGFFGNVAGVGHDALWPG